ncbi:MAG TPA: DNA polymerase Y family protein [Nitrolancea sp.]|nr:DNA polymerase Y family protein [Nitrolancea sp.]
MPLACLLIPHFALRLAVLEQPALDGLPLVLTAPSMTRPLVADASPEAAGRGIRVGMPLREVNAICPQAAFIPANPVRDALAFERVLGQLEAVSPALEPVEPGRCYVDIAGLDRHYPSPEAIAEALLACISPILRPRAGLAPTRFTAWAAARMAAPGTVRTIAAGEVFETLGPLPASWLPLEPNTLLKLDRLGLRTLAEIRNVPATALQARFGPAGRDAHACASGRDDARVYPRKMVESVREEFRLPAPMASREMLMLAIRQLVIRAFNRPALKHRQIRQARIRIAIEGGHSWERELTFREPVGSHRLIETLRSRLQTIELPGPAEMIHLDLIGIVSEIALQELIPLLRPKQDRPLIEAARQLKQRYGESPLAHVVEVEPWSRIPERRFALISYDP